MQNTHRKNRSFYLEYVLTFLLFFPTFFLFPPEISYLRICLPIGLLAGAYIGHAGLDKYHRFRKLTSLAVHIAVLLWTLYLVAHSSFLYRDEIIICIKSLAILIIAASCNSRLQGYLHSMQLYAIVLFLCVCAVTKELNAPFLVFGALFLALLFAVSRTGLKNSLDLRDPSAAGVAFVNAPFVIVLLAAGLTGWTLSTRISLGRITTKGFFTGHETRLRETKKHIEEEQDKVFSDERFQGELTQIVFRLSSTEEMHQALAVVQDLLMRDWLYAVALDGTEKSLLGILSDPRVGMDGAHKKALAGEINKYIHREISRKLELIEQQIRQAIENNRMGLWQRINLISTMNTIGESDSYVQAIGHSAKFQKAVNDAAISQAQKNELQRLGVQLKDWKSYQLYRKKLDSFQKDAASKDKGSAQDRKDLASDINDMDSFSEPQPIDTKIEKLGRPSSQAYKNLLDEARELRDLKKELLASKAKGEFLRALENSSLSLNKRKDAEAMLNTIEQSKDAQGDEKGISQFLDAMQEENEFQMPSESTDMIHAKIEALRRQAAQAFKKRVQENGLTDFQGELSENLQKLESQQRKDKIAFDAMRLQRSVESLFRQGAIPQEARDDLVKEGTRLQRLLTLRAELNEIGGTQKNLATDDQQDYEEKLAGLLQNAFSGEEQKEMISKLTDKLMAARTVAQVQETVGAIEKEIDSSLAKEQERQQMRELLQKASQDKKIFILEKSSEALRRKAEALKNKLPQKAALFNEKLDALRKSQTEEEAIRNVVELEALSQSKELQKERVERIPSMLLKDGNSQDSPNIHLLPSYVILPMGSSITLESVAAYSSFVKDLSPELEWISSNPSVASVDQNGSVYAESKGEAEITAWYQGISSRKCVVTVVNKIPALEASRIKNEAEAQANR